MDQKPASGKMPASASVPIRYSQNVTGICLAQAAHVAHVAGVEDLLALCASSMPVRQMMMPALHAQDDRTGGEEEQRLEEGVRDQVEHAAT